MSKGGAFRFGVLLEARSTNEWKAMTVLGRMRQMTDLVSWFVSGDGTMFKTQYLRAYCEFPDGLDTGKMRVFHSAAGLAIDAALWAMIDSRIPAMPISRATWAHGRTNSTVLGEAAIATGWAHMGQDVADAWGIACEGATRSRVLDGGQPLA